MEEEEPSKFKNPSRHQYIGKEDPLSHIHYFVVQTNLQGVRDDVRCRIFCHTDIQWFLEVAAKTKNLSEDARVMPLAIGLMEISPLWFDLHLKAIYTMNDFLDRADGFIKLEEAIARAEGLNGGKRKSLDSPYPDTEAQGNGKKG
uniref:Uncharacterized protein n=1 Tax=Cannabis sativa TaxID=3483 RepID=A0A803QC28_CANSA